jgi:uncharacterized protein (TIGR02285 family)
MTLLRLPLALAAACAWAQPSTPVHWLVVDFPPYEIHSGPDNGSGLMDHYLQSLIQRLPQFQHNVDVVGFQRRDALMKTTLPSCTVSRFSTPERALYAVFAQRPFLFLLPPRLVTTKKLAEPLSSMLDHDAAPLTRLLTNGQYVLGIYPARHFGDAIDHQIEEIRADYPMAIRDYRETGSTSIVDLLNIMAHGGFDMTLAYTVEGEYLRRANPTLPGLEYFPIAGATSLLPLSISCNKTPLGLNVVKAVEQLGAHDPAAAQAQRELEALLPPEEKRRYEALLPKAK